MKEQKRKIAFVIVRYGKDINGGAEVHCKMLAERLTEKFQVEVLTTCVKDYKEGTNVYPIGEEKINGVLVSSFIKEFDIDDFYDIEKMKTIGIDTTKEFKLELKADEKI